MLNLSLPTNHRTKLNIFLLNILQFTLSSIMPPHYRLSPSLGSLPLLHHFSEPNHLSRNGCLASCRNQTRNASITNASAERATKSLQKVPTQMSYKSRQKNISSKEIPTDLGLLPGLFIFPEANGVAPKWLSKNGFKRLKLELFYLRDQARSFAAYVTLLAMPDYLSRASSS